MGRRAGVLVALLVLAAVAPSARADHSELHLPWPDALPPRMDVPTAAQPHSVPNCRRPSVRCVTNLARRQTAKWREWNATCDHRAVMGVSYLRITEALAEDLGRRPPRLFRYPQYMAFVIADFSNMWFKANADYAAGKPVVEAWQIALDAMTEGDVSAGQDILLFSNAHVQHDLPFVYERMGLRTRDGRSRKPDHDAVNRINNQVLDPTQDQVAVWYDPTFGTIDLKPSPVDELGSMQLVQGWREGAWRNAERLLLARTAAERAAVVDSIRTTSTLWARALAAPAFPGFRAMRDAYCASHHPG